MKITKWIDREFIIHAVKFGLVGIFNTVLCNVAIWFFQDVVKLPYAISNPLGYILGLVNSFIMNKTWTFQSQRGVLRDLFMFMVVWLPCFFIQLGLSILMIKGMHMNDKIATLLANIIFTGLNFLGNKYISFRK